MTPKHPDLLGTDPRPLFFPLANSRDIGLAPPANRRGMALRTWVRALAGMQKEALVINGATGRAWRLTSDEGPYLAGHDVSPCPLSFLTTGMVSSYMNEILALAEMREVEIRDLELTLDNYYSMEGSALRGTMSGGALPPQLRVRIDCAAEPSTVTTLLTQAIDASPINGLMRGQHASLFTLSLNGRQIEVDRVAAIARPAEPDPGDRFPEVVAAAAGTGDDTIRKVAAGKRLEGVKHGVNSSLQDSQSRTLHVRGRCTVRSDGVKEVEQSLFKPLGSTFRYLSDEAPEFGGEGRAPDAATYMSAGIGFCFMTQFGRYAEIVKKQLPQYRIVQDTHFSLGGASGSTGVAGTAEPVETHVYLETPEDEAFARTILDMSEQTCFLHAFCRTDLKTRLRLEETAPAVS